MKAMILAAGKGERMRPLTLKRPKPLLQAGGRALIDYHIDRLHAAGYSHLVINHAWLGEQLENHLGDGRSRGVAIAWSREGEPLETAGGIRKALPQLEGEGDWFLVVNGDIWCDVDFTALSPPDEGLALLVLAPNPSHNPGGDFRLNADGGVHIEGEPRYTYTGIALLKRQLFSGAYGTEAKLGPLLRRAAQAGKVKGRLHRGHWFDIGTPERLEQLDGWLRNQDGNT